MHPIHYSLIMNFLILVISGSLAWFLEQPLLFVIGLMVINHLVGRFEDSDDEEPSEYSGNGMGFVSDADR